MPEIDLSDTIIAKSDQLNAADIAESLTIKITSADKKTESEQPVSIYYEGCGKKPWKPCKSMRRVIAKIWGSKVDMTGKSMTLICDPTVTWAGQEVGGIRISHMSGIDKPKTLQLRITQKKVVKYVVQPLSADKAPKQAPPSDLYDEAKEAAELGVDSYISYLGELSDDQKQTLKQHHKELSAIAKEADSEEEPAI